MKRSRQRTEAENESNQLRMPSLRGMIGSNMNPADEEKARMQHAASQAIPVAKSISEVKPEDPFRKARSAALLKILGK